MEVAAIGIETFTGLVRYLVKNTSRWRAEDLIHFNQLLLGDGRLQQNEEIAGQQGKQVTKRTGTFSFERTLVWGAPALLA